MELNTVNNSLDTGKISKEQFKDLLDELLNCSSKHSWVKDNESLVPSTFYRMMKSYNQYLPDEKLVDTCQSKLVNFFKNTRGITSKFDLYSIDSYQAVYWLLDNLMYLYTGDNAVELIERSSEILKKNARKLLYSLEAIQCIFDIKDKDGKLVFPIEKVIGEVLKNYQFENKITNDTVCVFQLAVRLFKPGNENHVLNELKNPPYNLKFIKYLEANTSALIDNENSDNYKYNDVMIFWDGNHKFLIRGTDKNYFEGKCEAEKNKVGDEIGYFMEKTLSEGDMLLSSYDNIMSEHKNLIPFLKLFFDDGYRNVLLDHSVYRNENGNLVPVNEFSNKDKWIVTQDNKYIRRDSIEDIIDVFNGYRLNPVYQKELNVLTFGLCMRLLLINKISIEKMGVEVLNNSTFYQNQIIERWVVHSMNKFDCIEKMLNEWIRQLEYIKSELDLKKYNAQVQDFLPYKFDVFSLINILFEENRLCKIIKGKVIEKKGNRFIKIESEIKNKGKKESTDISINILYGTKDESDYLIDEKVYLLKDENNDYFIANDPIIIEQLFKLDSFIKNGLGFDECKGIVQGVYDDISNKMKMFEKEFQSISGFEKQNNYIYYRMLHNLLASVEDKDDLRDYISLMKQPRILSFEGFDKDETFLGQETGVLYIPKDKDTEDSVLSELYNEIPSVERRKKNLYWNRISQREDDQYYFNGARIEKIVLLTDNYMNGCSTVDTLHAYLYNEDRPKKDKLKRIMPYYCGDTVINISEIIHANNAPIRVHAYYGTEEGKREIDEYLNQQRQEKNIYYESADYEVKIETNIDDTIIEAANRLWKVKLPASFKYSYIRKHNMPKYSLYAPWMMEGKRAVAVFVKKKEHL